MIIQPPLRNSVKSKEKLKVILKQADEFKELKENKRILRELGGGGGGGRVKKRKKKTPPGVEGSNHHEKKNQKTKKKCSQ